MWYRPLRSHCLPNPAMQFTVTTPKINQPSTGASFMSSSRKKEPVIYRSVLSSSRCLLHRGFIAVAGVRTLRR